MEHEQNKSKPFVDKFTLSSCKLNMILRDQKAIFDKACLGFKSYVKQKFVNNLYRKYVNENMSCSYYEKLGHKLYECKYKINIKLK